MGVRSAGLFAFALLALAACGSSKQSSSPSTATATHAKTSPAANPQTGCKTQNMVGDRLTLRVQLTAAKAAKYTVARLEDAPHLTVNSVTDETKAHGRSNGIRDEYLLPGPRSAGATKTVVVTMTAAKPGTDAVYLRAWASNQATSAQPGNSASTACPVVILPH